MCKLIIHAANVHQGGGRSLLMAILNTLPCDMKTILVLDKRLSLPSVFLQQMEVRRISPSVIDRFEAEKWLVDNVAAGDLVLCFGNLPPLFKLRGNVVVFVQNRYLIDDVNLDGFSLKTRLRIRVERIWLSCRISNIDEIVVQTPSMKRLLEVRTKRNIPITVLPFVGVNNGYERRIQPLKESKEKDIDFLYVASGEPHKNHRQLIEAWCLLAKEGVFPSLKITLDREKFAEVNTWLEQRVNQYQLKIDNVGTLPSDQVRLLYERTRALIYPSTFESFGLPLIEARQSGLPVLASELDYVRDVLDPEQTFDPESAVSIARAVKRFMAIEEQALPLHDANGFMQHIIGRAK